MNELVCKYRLSAFGLAILLSATIAPVKANEASLYDFDPVPQK